MLYQGATGLDKEVRAIQPTLEPDGGWVERVGPAFLSIPHGDSQLLALYASAMGGGPVDEVFSRAVCDGDGAWFSGRGGSLHCFASLVAVTRVPSYRRSIVDGEGSPSRRKGQLVMTRD